MRYLLDTQIFLWWITDDDRLRPELRKVMTAANSGLLWSVASSWEVGIRADPITFPMACRRAA